MWKNILEKTVPTYHYGSQKTVESLVPFMNTLLGKGGTVTDEEKMGVTNQLARAMETTKAGSMERLGDLGLGGSPELRASVEAGGQQSLQQALSSYYAQVPEISRRRGLEGMQTVQQMLANLFKGTSKTTNIRGGSTSTTAGSSSGTGPQFDPSALQYMLRSPGPNWMQNLGQLMTALAASGVFPVDSNDGLNRNALQRPPVSDPPLPPIGS
jgi:hypothetical protein